MPNEQIFFKNYTDEVFWILMKFGTLVDLTKNGECKKIFEKLPLLMEL